MIGLIAIILIIVVFGGIGFVSGWLFAIWDERSGILSSPKRFLWYLFGLGVLFLALFGDEIIGKMQFDELCRKAEFKLLVDETELKDKKLIYTPQEYGSKKIFFISNDYSLYSYKDSDTQKIYFLSEIYWPPHGWLAKLASLGNKNSLMFPKLNNGFCRNYRYNELKKQYEFSSTYSTK